jgi:hypothetical protein
MVVPFVYTEEEYKKLEEERDFYKEQAILWRNDYKNEYEENKKLKSDLSLVIKERDDNIRQNKKLNEYNRRLKQANEDLRKQNRYWNKIVDIIPQDEKSVAEETIQDLLKEIKRLEEELESVKEDNIILNNNRNSSVEYSRELEKKIKD